MSRRPIYRWDGAYFGFFANTRVFDATGNYLGWVDDRDRVWHADGTYCGEVVDDNYILRPTNRADPPPRLPRVPPVPPLPRLPSVPRLPRLPRLGWQDALEGCERS